MCWKNLNFHNYYQDIKTIDRILNILESGIPDLPNSEDLEWLKKQFDSKEFRFDTTEQFGLIVSFLLKRTKDYMGDTNKRYIAYCQHITPIFNALADNTGLSEENLTALIEILTEYKTYLRQQQSNSLYSKPSQLW